MTFPFERLQIKEKTQECIFCTNFRSDQISAFSFKNQAATIVLLLSTPLFTLSRVKIDPHVVPNKWSRFDLPIIISCTASLVRSYQPLWNGSWLIQLTDNQVCCPAEKSFKMDEPDAYLHWKSLDPALGTKTGLSCSLYTTRVISVTLNSIYVVFMFSLGWALRQPSAWIHLYGFSQLWILQEIFLSYSKYVLQVYRCIAIEQEIEHNSQKMLKIFVSQKIRFIPFMTFYKLQSPYMLIQASLSPPPENYRKSQRSETVHQRGDIHDLDNTILKMIKMLNTIAFTAFTFYCQG